jgi:glutamate carboxypeptidase
VTDQLRSSGTVDSSRDAWSARSVVDTDEQEVALAFLRDLVNCESPSTEPRATRACAELLAQWCSQLLSARGELITEEGNTHLLLRGAGQSRVVVLCHLDTVWPLGTIGRRPFTIDGSTIRGPGVFDMKAGIVAAVLSMRRLATLSGVTLLVNSDEEIGSPTSRSLIAQLARSAGVVLVLEPGHHGALKTARKGMALYRIEVHGRAAHAGLEPELGSNALLEAARRAEACAGLARPDLGTSVIPTVLSAGTAVNVVPAQATLQIDSRAFTAAEQERVDAAIRALRPTVAGVTVDVHGGINRGPLPAAATAALFARAQRVAERIGLAPLRETSVGSVSDGNLAAAAGAAVLDGLGPAGDGGHAEHEYVTLAGLAESIRLTSALLADLLGHT